MTAWRTAWDAVVDDLTFTVVRRERGRRAAFSSRARQRNGYRPEPGVAVEWVVTLDHPDPVLDYVIEHETPSVHATRTAALAAVEDVRARIRRFWPSRVTWLDEEWDGSDIPARVAQRMSA